MGKEERSTHWGKWVGPKPELVLLPPSPPKQRKQRNRRRPPPPSPSPFLNVREVADFLRISPMTVYRLVKLGKIAGAFKVGYDWRFDPKLLQEWTEA